MMSCFPIFFFFIIVIGIITAVLVMTFKNAEGTRSIWRQAASRLKLRFMPGSLTEPGQISGKINNHRIIVDTYKPSSNNNSTRFTRYRVYYSKTLDLGLKLTHQRYLDIGRFFGSQDIEIGISSFDEKVVVKGKNPDRIKSFLNREKCRTIMKLMSKYTNITIEDNLATIKTMNLENNGSVITNTIQALINLADTMIEPEEEHKDSPEEKIEEQETNSQQPPSQPEQKEEETAKEETSTEPSIESVIDKLEAEVVEDQIEITSEEIEDLTEENADTPPPIPTVPEESTEKPAEQKPETPYSEAEEQEESKPPKESPKKESISSIIKQKVATTGIQNEPLKKEVEVKQQEIDEVLESLKSENFSLASICNYLFADSSFSTDIMKKFERLSGHTVEWQGTLESAQKFFSDFTFKDTTGTKATVKLYEMSDKFGLKTTVKAIIHFPTEEYDYLNTQRTKTIKFTGQFLKVEGFSKEIYISNGQVIK